jgi:phosphopantetheinyl transferase (holo-ACP synthase)
MIEIIISLSNERNELQGSAKNVITELFKLQEEYYKSFNQEMTNNTKLKQLLVLYNQKYRTQLKKSNKIKESFESNNIKNTLTLTINREESARFKDMVTSNKSELTIFKKILKVTYNDNELNTFKEENKLTGGKNDFYS